MSGPWEQYQNQPAAAPASGGGAPWLQYQGQQQPAPSQDPQPAANPSHWYDTAVHELGDLNEGFTTGLSQTGGTAERMLAKIPGVRPLIQKSMDADAARAARPLDTGGKIAGNVIENILEFAGGDEALKGLSVADKATKLGKLASTLEKYPKVAQILAKQGAMGTAQAAAHGADAKDALEAGAVAGVGGAALEGAGNLLGKGVEAIRPGTRSIGGVDVPTLASQEPGASAAAASAADIRSTPEFRQAQQAAGGKVVAKTAQQAARDSIERLNRTRVRPLVTDPARMLPAPEGMKPFEFTMDGAEPTETVTDAAATGRRDYPSAGTREVPNPDYRPGGEVAAGDLGSRGETVPARSFTGKPTTTRANYQEIGPAPGQGSVMRGGGGTRTFTDPGEANAALSHYQQIMDSDAFESMSPRQQSKIQAQADSLRDQLDTHGAYRARASHFEPIDADAATRNVESFHDAAQQVEGSVSDVYSKLDSLSENKWRDLRKQEVGTRKMIRNTTSPDSLDAAQGRLADIQKQQSDIFEANKDQISPDEWRAANAAWKDASTLRDIHDAVQGSFKGAPEDVKLRNPNIYRELKGDRLTGRLNTLLSKRGDDVDRVLGTAGKDSLYQLGDLLKKPEGVQGATGRVKAMAMAARRHGHTIGGLAGGALGYSLGGGGGAAVGGILGATGEMATEHAYRRAVNAIATRPELARRLIYATKNNVAPHIAGPLLASMMIRDDSDQQQSQ